MENLRRIFLGCGFLVGAVGCGGGGGTPSGPGTVTAEWNGDTDALGDVELTCDRAGPSATSCSFGGQPPDDGLELSLSITTDYAAAAEGTVLAMGTDFSVTGFSFFTNSVGFGAGGNDIAVGTFTITLGAHGADGTRVTFDGELSKPADFPGEDWTITFDQVPGTLP